MADSDISTDIIADEAELLTILADLGDDAVEGSYLGVPLELFCMSPTGGDYASSTDPVPGMYVTAHFPMSLMADLLLECSSSLINPEDPLAAVDWSGTSKDYVESCLRGPLLDWMVSASESYMFELRDQLLSFGPLPQSPKEAVVVVTSICRVVSEHFDGWSVPAPNFDDDED